MLGLFHTAVATHGVLPFLFCFVSFLFLYLFCFMPSPGNRTWHLSLWCHDTNRWATCYPQSDNLEKWSRKRIINVKQVSCFKYQEGVIEETRAQDEEVKAGIRNAGTNWSWKVRSTKRWWGQCCCLGQKPGQNTWCSWEQWWWSA
jgi:hypothetical protein